VSDPSAAQDAARAVAWADAVRAAEMYAALAGRTLGAATKITEVQTLGMTPRGAIVLASQASSRALPVEAGQLSISATVKVTWQLV